MCAANVSRAMSKKLVIVESPAKAKTIAGYLGGDFVVESSIGHIRDLPNRASDVPKEMRAKYGTMGVAIDDDFEPYYIVDPDKKRIVTELRRKLKDADELLLATDEDREGEAIAWHLLEELKPKVPVRRMVFHEITREAIQRALGETREVDKRLVDAQETRRILDRLYGYEVSPVLWKKVMQGLSAGRVQSVAVRLVVERERERRAFVSASYWDLEGRLRSRLVRGAARRRRRQARGPGSRLRPGRNAPDCGHGRARRAGGARPRRRARRCDLHRSLGRREAVHAPPGGAVHDLDAAAGGEPQAPLLGADDDAGRPAAVRQRLHHLHAHRLDDAVGVGAGRRAQTGRRALRPRLDPGAAEAVHPQGQERAGGARGDPAGRRLLPDAEVPRARARSRRARPLRADLEADARLADGRRARADGLAAVRHDDAGRPRRRVRRLRHGDHLPRLPRRLRGEPRRRAVRRRRQSAAAAPRAGRRR